MMYWNSRLSSLVSKRCKSWEITYDVLKFFYCAIQEFIHMLRNNIWCIEILLNGVWLEVVEQLRNNIWCIEMTSHLGISYWSSKLRNNIWCIEIYKPYEIGVFYESWEITYDVLKSSYPIVTRSLPTVEK